MKVVLDTNIIFSDFHLNGAKIKDLCESAKSIGATIYIPAVVIDESINKYCEKIQDCKTKIDKVFSDFERLTDKKVNLSQKSIDVITKEKEEYAKFFNAQIRRLNINIIPYPSTSHKDLVSRDLARKRPFQESGKGYRDALIWESLLTICTKPNDLFDMPQVVFINKNHKDFCLEGDLHPDLREDLSKLNINEEHVEVVEDIDVFIKKFAKPKQKILQKIKDAFQSHGSYADINIIHETEQRLDKFLLYRQFDYENSPFRQEFENPSVVEIGKPEIKLDEVRQISENEVVIEYTVNVECTFDVFLFKADAMCMDEEELPQVWDNDWNKHYMAASDTATINLKIFLIVDNSFTKVLSDDIEIIDNADYQN